VGAITRKSFDAPDERRALALGIVELTHLGPYTIGRGTLEPGWRWSTHMRPIVGTPSCPVHHLQVLLSGRFAYRMDSGEQIELGPGDITDIPPGHDAWVVGDEPAVMIDIGGNIGSVGVPAEHERVVTTIVMTDIVDSTRTAARLGDRAWRQVLEDHNRIVRAQLGRYRGSEVSTTGDGFVATFESAVAAVRCADAIRAAVRSVGVDVRVGVHTGEVERTPSDIGGIAVHAAARIMALAGPSEVLVSATTRSLVEGSGLAFEERGVHQVKGLDRPVEVYRLVDGVTTAG
jgi:class 3 adenylate cyclase